MIEKEDAKKVIEVIGNNLIGVSHDSSSFQKLPDSFWGYFARGHDKKGTFGVIVTYSEEGKEHTLFQSSGCFLHELGVHSLPLLHCCWNLVF